MEVDQLVVGLHGHRVQGALGQGAQGLDEVVGLVGAQHGPGLEGAGADVEGAGAGAGGVGAIGAGQLQALLAGAQDHRGRRGAGGVGGGQAGGPGGQVQGSVQVVGGGDDAHGAPPWKGCWGPHAPCDVSNHTHTTAAAQHHPRARIGAPLVVARSGRGRVAVSGSQQQLDAAGSSSPRHVPPSPPARGRRGRVPVSRAGSSGGRACGPAPSRPGARPADRRARGRPRRRGCPRGPWPARP